MQAHKLLAPKKLEAASKKEPHYIKGKPLKINAAVQQRYIDSLMALVSKMTDDVEKKVTALFKSHTAQVYFAVDESIASQARILTNQLTFKWDTIFAKHSRPKAKKMVAQTSAASAADLAVSLKELSGGLSISTDILTGSLNDILTASVAANVSLIKSIPQEYLHQVKGSVMRSITTGNGLQDLVPDLMQYKGITKRRATNIALDQTRKTYNAFNTERSQKIGLDEGEWLHTGGGIHPRDTHIGLMNGQIYKLSQGCYDPDYGGFVQPGQLVFCKCSFRPVLKFGG